MRRGGEPSFAEISADLELNDFDATFPAGWLESMRTFPRELPFLATPFIETYAPAVSLSTGATAALIEVAAAVRERAALERMLWHEYRLFSGVAAQDVNPMGYPDLQISLGPRAGTANLLLALSAVPAALSFYRIRGVPADVQRATLSDFAVWDAYSVRHYSEHGISPRILDWLSRHLSGRLFRLGRLQYVNERFAGTVTAFRHRESGAVCALAEPGLEFDEEGLLTVQRSDAVRGIRKDPAASARAATMRRTQRGIAGGVATGNRVSPEGRITVEQIALDLDAWEVVLEPGRPVMEMHIPGGARLDGVGESLDAANLFFSRLFPERPFSAFTCESWFLDPAVDGFLPENANIRRFARELYRYPSDGPEDESLLRIFGPHLRDRALETLGTATMLQKKALAHLQAGGALRPGGGFILRDDLPWGGGRYADRR